MVTPQLLDYIRQRLMQGAGTQEVSQALLSAGWQKEDIDEALGKVGQEIRLSGYQFFHREVAPKQTVHRNVLFVALSVVIILFGASAWAYFYFLPSLPPQVVFSRMLEHMGNTTSVAYEGEVRVDVDTDTIPLPSLSGVAGLFFLQDALNDTSTQTPLLITFKGASDARDVKHPKGFLDMDVNVIASPQDQFSLGVQTRMIEKMFYIKLTKLALEGASPYLNKWISIDTQIIAQRLGVDEKELEQRHLERLRDELFNARVVEFTKSLPQEVVAGKRTYHFGYAFNKQGFKEFLFNVQDIFEEKGLTKEDIDNLEAALDFLDLLDGEIWIGQEDFLLYRITLNLQIEDTKKAQQFAALSLTFDVSDYNKPVNISPPTGTISLEELVKQRAATPLPSP